MLCCLDTVSPCVGGTAGALLSAVLPCCTSTGGAHTAWQILVIGCCNNTVAWGCEQWGSVVACGLDCRAVRLGCTFCNQDRDWESVHSRTAILHGVSPQLVGRVQCASVAPNKSRLRAAECCSHCELHHCICLAHASSQSRLAASVDAAVEASAGQARWYRGMRMSVEVVRGTYLCLAGDVSACMQYHLGYVCHSLTWGVASGGWLGITYQYQHVLQYLSDACHVCCTLHGRGHGCLCMWCASGALLFVGSMPFHGIRVHVNLTGTWPR